MRAPISVIIPTLNAANSLPATLNALGEGLEAGLIRELILSDGGSHDETLDIADQAGALLVQGAASRGGQLRRGAIQAQGDWLLFLHADTCLQPGWSEAVLKHLPTELAGYFRLRFDVGGGMARWVSGWANFRARVFRLPYGDQGLLLPRTVYDAVGGFDDTPLMEDVSIVRRLRGRLVRINATAQTDAQRYIEQGWLRRGARNLWLLARYFGGAPADRLSQSYGRRH